MDQNKGFVIRKIAEACLKDSYLYFSKITGLHSDYYLFFIALNMGQTWLKKYVCLNKLAHIWKKLLQRFCVFSSRVMQ